MNLCKYKLILVTLIFASFCLINGCGSDNSSGVSASRKDQKPQAKKKAEVVELLVNGNQKKGVSSKPVAPMNMGTQNIEVTPPVKVGELGATNQEIEAAKRASKMIDPKTIEVIPPSKPGERGLTQAQVDSLKPKQAIDPKTIEVIPPSKPGEHGITQAQLEALQPKQAFDAKTIEVIPPSKPGERGVTAQEMETIRSSQKKSSDASKLPPMPPPAK